uniref:Uncharacterized protein n=1 Tax=Cannabis sativa TaxID=3483 RepID=A0A803Q3Y4_CANSA
MRVVRVSGFGGGSAVVRPLCFIHLRTPSSCRPIGNEHGSSLATSATAMLSAGRRSGSRSYVGKEKRVVWSPEIPFGTPAAMVASSGMLTNDDSSVMVKESPAISHFNKDSLNFKIPCANEESSRAKVNEFIKEKNNSGPCMTIGPRQFLNTYPACGTAPSLLNKLREQGKGQVVSPFLSIGPLAKEKEKGLFICKNNNGIFGDGPPKTLSNESFICGQEVKLHHDEKLALSNFFQTQNTLLQELKNFGSLDLYEIKAIGGDFGVPTISETIARSTPLKKRKFDGASTSLCPRPWKLLRPLPWAISDFSWNTEKSNNATNVKEDEPSGDISLSNSESIGPENWCTKGKNVISSRPMVGTFVVEDSVLPERKAPDTRSSSSVTRSKDDSMDTNQDVDFGEDKSSTKESPPTSNSKGKNISLSSEEEGVRTHQEAEINVHLKPSQPIISTGGIDNLADNTELSSLNEATGYDQGNQEAIPTPRRRGRPRSKSSLVEEASSSKKKRGRPTKNKQHLGATPKAFKWQKSTRYGSDNFTTIKHLWEEERTGIIKGPDPAPPLSQAFLEKIRIMQVNGSVVRKKIWHHETSVFCSMKRGYWLAMVPSCRHWFKLESIVHCLVAEFGMDSDGVQRVWLAFSTVSPVVDG